MTAQDTLERSGVRPQEVPLGYRRSRFALAHVTLALVLRHSTFVSAVPTQFQIPNSSLYSAHLKITSGGGKNVQNSTHPTVRARDINSGTMNSSVLMREA